MVRRILYPALVLAVLAGFAWALWPRPALVEAARIDRRTIEVQVAEEGTSRIREVFSVSAPILGRMVRLELHAGDRVTAGKTIVARLLPVAPALLDARSRRIAEATLQAAEAAVDLARAEVLRARAQLAFLKTEAERAVTLRSREAISERALEMAQLDQTVAEAGLVSAEANLTARERERDSARAALTDGDTDAMAPDCCTNVLAPASGTVLRVLTESEQVVQPGQPLLEIGDPSDIEIKVDLLSSDAVRVAPGAKAWIEGWGGPALPARVLNVDPSASTKVSALGIEEQRVKVTLGLEDAAGNASAGGAGLGDGYRVTARITLWKGGDLVAIPVGALFRTGADWATYVIEGGRAVQRTIALGERNDAFAQVTAGLQPGDLVILHPSDQITDGARVSTAPSQD